jgi:hypothetical protein
MAIRSVDGELLQFPAFWDSGADRPQISVHDFNSHPGQEWGEKLGEANLEEVICVYPDVRVVDEWHENVECTVDGDETLLGTSVSKHYDQYLSIPTSTFLFGKGTYGENQYSELVAYDATLTFQIHYADPTSSVCVSGSLPELGNWNISNRLQLCQQANGVWTRQIRVLPNINFMCKLLVTDGSGNVLRWENGDNRSNNTSLFTYPQSCNL